jgi:xylitol oxidase
VLQAVPQFNVRQCPFPNVPVRALLDDVEAFFKHGYSVSGFTDWKSADTLTGVWIKSLAEDEEEKEEGVATAASAAAACGAFYGQTATPLHPLPGLDPKGCTPMGVVSSEQGLPHFLASEAPSGGGEELQSEYFVDMKHAKAAIEALFRVADQLAEYILVSEFRVVRSDAFPLSLCYDRERGPGGSPCVGLHFTWKDDLEAVTTRMVPLVEKTLAQWEPRPHHGKIHTVGVEEWRQRYPGWRKVAALARRNDPEGRFVNAFLAKYLGLGDGGVGGGDRDGDNVCNDRVDGETCADGSISRGNNNAATKQQDAPKKTAFLSPYVGIVRGFVVRHRMAVAFAVIAVAVVAPFVMLKFVMDLAL